MSFDLGGTIVRDDRGPATGELGDVLGIPLARMRSYLGTSAKRRRMAPAELARVLGAAFDRPDAVSTLEQVLVRRREAGSHPHCYSDVEPVLRELRARGFRIAFLSNVVGAIAGPPTGLPLYELADAVLMSCDTGFAKPERSAFANAARRLSVDLYQLMHVGDAWGADVNGALDAGCVGVHLARGEANGRHSRLDGTDRCHRITDLAELLDLLPDRCVERMRGKEYGP